MRIGGRRPEAINLQALAVAAQREHRARQVAERLRVGSAWDDGDLVFCTTIETPLDPRNVLMRSRAI